MALVAFLGFAPAAQADFVSPHDFAYTYGAQCGLESGVVEYMFTDITNNTSAAIEFLVTMDGETVGSQVLNPGESMPDFIRPWPFQGFLEMFAVDPTGVKETQRHIYGSYSYFHSCVDPVITFEEHGGSEVTDPQCVDGEQFEIPVAPTRDDFTFIGWNSAADGTGTAYEVGSMHDCLGLITIHAVWDELIFEDLDGTPPAWLTADEFQYTYGGRCGPETGVVEFMLTGIGNNSPHVIEVIVSVDLDHSDGTPGETVASQVLNPGDTMPDVILPFPFLSLLEVFAADPTGVEANQRMHSANYSVFHSCGDPVITFEEHGGSEVTDPQCVDGEQFEIPAAPTRDGFTFTGWNSAADGTGTAYDIGSMHDCLGIVTIHATWTALLIDVTDPIDPISPEPVDPVAPVDPAAEEFPEFVLPATGSESSILILSALALSLAGLSLMAITRFSRRST